MRYTGVGDPSSVRDDAGLGVQREHRFLMTLLDSCYMLLAMLTSSELQALRVIRVRRLASIRARTGRGTSITLASTLSVLRYSSASRSTAAARGGWSRSRLRGGGVGWCGSATAAGAELALNECERSLTVLCAVALVGVGVAAVAAVRVCGVAVRLNLAGDRAGEACWAGSELGFTR